MPYLTLHLTYTLFYHIDAVNDFLQIFLQTRYHLGQMQIRFMILIIKSPITIIITIVCKQNKRNFL